MLFVKRSVALLALLVLAVAPAQGKPPASTKTPSDKDFLAKAWEGGTLEVQLAQKAKDKASSEEVKKFAQRMLNDHTESNQKLMEIAKEMKVAVAAGVTKEKRKVLLQLTKAKGADFDRQYMQHMVEDHEKNVAEFEAYARNGKNEKLRSFAAKTLPTLRQHLRLARAINAKLKK